MISLVPGDGQRRCLGGDQPLREEQESPRKVVAGSEQSLANWLVSWSWWWPQGGLVEPPVWPGQFLQCQRGVLEAPAGPACLLSPVARSPDRLLSPQQKCPCHQLSLALRGPC